jgi:hypothetical protein
MADDDRAEIRARFQDRGRSDQLARVFSQQR